MALQMSYASGIEIQNMELGNIKLFHYSNFWLSILKRKSPSVKILDT